MRLARQLRQVAPTSVDLTGRSLKAQLRTAGKGDALLGVLLGEAELERGEATLRDLRAGEQRAVSLEDLVEAVQASLQSSEAQARS